MTREVARFAERSFMNKRLGFVFVALIAVPVALLGQEKPPASSAPPANPITASEIGGVINPTLGASHNSPKRRAIDDGSTSLLAHLL
jgi:hypothetical protein